jgi:hypothetical protein
MAIIPILPGQLNRFIIAIIVFVTGDFLFVHYGYDGDLAPSLTLHRDGAEHFESLAPRGKTLTLSFDTGTRYCTGWHDLATSESSPCPEQATIITNYDQCMHCQRKTGFNPAFYNASSVSEQQQARNAEPHILYLAHFGPGVVKVGISYSKRGIRRLLDQGARSALIIKDYPNANIARQYEAKIAALDGIAETLQLKTKYRLLAFPYDPDAGVNELLNTRQRLIEELKIQPDDNQPLLLEPHYLGEHTFAPHQLVHLQDGRISGKSLGMIGSSYIAEQDGTPYFLSLGNLTGYKVAISEDEQPNVHAPQQVSLF